MCRLKDHNQAWSKCPNNPISKNFSGKSYTEIPASERYENDFGKKAKKMAKEEKDAKKTVSINDIYEQDSYGHNQQGTDAVSLDDDDDDPTKWS